jgi:hypothetical protein
MKAVKEGFIIILLLIVVAATLGILYYNCFPNNKITPVGIEYTTGAETKATLDQIASTTTTAKEDELLNGADDGVSNGTILASYTVGASDINRANRINRIREGKSNPFSDAIEDYSGTSSGGNGGSGSSSSSTQGTSSSSQGSLFEKSNNK